ncbi:DUF2075 domain-containing protein [Cellulomonas citrea]|uniref:DUF2075 domain-containing protein n=1 Tax=Cellulomonas citrea TaxID=1909423 RepID=UPI0013576AB7|nr:DUF2075 domain-containing protein [Cellulomonas citrea]
MTPSDIEGLRFTRDAIDDWARRDPRHTNWPVVYVLDGEGRGRGARTAVYVGESIKAATRMRQHLASGTKAELRNVRVVVDETFNKSVCLDLESYLIQLFSGDGGCRLLNRNDGITNAEYFHRDLYRPTFAGVFEALRREGLFTRSIAEIENSDLFKLSPFKALTQDQAIAVEDILEGLFADLEGGRSSSIVIQGRPGTGKTIVAIYLMKMLADIQVASSDDVLDPDSMFAEFFTEEHRTLLTGFRLGLVIPQQSLRTSIRKVFGKTPGLRADMVLSPFDVGRSEQRFDLLVVDETHRLSQRANQPSGVLNRDFRVINERLFGVDDPRRTQLDWVIACSAHRVFLVDAEQTVRPADLSTPALEALSSSARRQGRFYPLTTQMRVRAGGDYVGYVRAVLRPSPGELARPDPSAYEGYDLRMFDDFALMRSEIIAMDEAHGLARLVAGFAWEWKSKKDPSAYDIEIDGSRLRWNSTDRDWINAPGSLEEVGSIHTVQGYDLNYAGVVIGPDLRYDPVGRQLFVDRASYRDMRGKERRSKGDDAPSDKELRRYIVNIYGVLLTRGMLGTFVYVCDPALREYLRPFLGQGQPGPTTAV